MMQTLGMAHEWNPYPGDILESWQNLANDHFILLKWSDGKLSVQDGPPPPPPEIFGAPDCPSWCIVEVPKEPEPKPVTFWDISQVLRLGKVLQEGDELTRMLGFLDEKAEEEEEEQPQPAVEPEEPEAEAKPRIWGGKSTEVRHWCWFRLSSRIAAGWILFGARDLLQPGDIFVGGGGQRPTVDPTGMQLEDCSVVDWLGTKLEENAEPEPEVKPAFTYEEAREFILKEHARWVVSEGVTGTRLRFVCANLRKADLREADLTMADLSEACVDRADFTDVEVHLAYLGMCASRDQLIRKLQ